MKSEFKFDEVEKEPRKMSVLTAYRQGKITQEIYLKYFNDGYNVKTTLIDII